MTGVPGLGILLVLAFVLLFYLPFITVKILAKLTPIDRLPDLARMATFAIAYLLFMGLTLILIRAYPYEMIDWQLLYAVLATLLYFTVKWIQQEKKPAA
jgi:Ca2+/Na+ antiporter